MKRNSIRARITAITAAAILTTVLTVVVVMALTIQRENDRKSVEMMNLIADDTGKSVERYLDSIEQSLDTAANLANDSIDSMLLIECGAAGSHSVPPSERTEEQNERLDEYLAACVLRRTAADHAEHLGPLVRCELILLLHKSGDQ